MSGSFCLTKKISATLGFFFFYSNILTFVEKYTKKGVFPFFL